MTNEEFIKSISEEGEEWRDVVGYENLYKVSNFGRIVSLSRNIQNRRNFVSKPRLLVPFHKTTGYLEVFLCKNGHRKHSVIHRIVAIAFIDNPHNYPHIDHIDTNKLNNHINNLRWVTRGMNQMNPLTRKHMSESRKGIPSMRPSPRRRAVVQLLNGKLLKTYECVYHVKKHGFSNSSVIRCCKNKQLEHGGYQWMYKSDYEQIN